MSATKAKGFAAQSANSKLKEYEFERRSPLDNDVSIEIYYCGVCHSDIHTVRNEWKNSHYPIIPGHEIVGKITALGKNVNEFKVGDNVGVGCLVDSCQKCSSCKDGYEQYCNEGFTPTYNGKDEIGGTSHEFTFGGYSDHIVVNKKFVLKIPSNLNLAATAPLLCAGITTYSPLKYWNVSKGTKVGIIGLGGLGHMGIKFAHAMGAEVVMITTSPEKGKDAKKLGANDVLLSTDKNAMNTLSNHFDVILNTIPVGHDVNPYLELLKRDGTMIILGAIEPLKAVNGAQLIFRRKKLAGSLIGGISETQEMLDFCGKNNITCDIEEISISEINEAYERTVKNDIKYRFVINMKSLTNK